MAKHSTLVDKLNNTGNKNMMTMICSDVCFRLNLTQPHQYDVSSDKTGKTGVITLAKKKRQCALPINPLGFISEFYGVRGYDVDFSEKKLDVKKGREHYSVSLIDNGTYVITIAQK